MIVRTPIRAIRYEDVKLGSLITIMSKNKNLSEYMVIKREYGGNNIRPYIEAVQIVPADTKEKNAHYLYADKVVLLHRTRVIELKMIQKVQARLAWDIVQNVVRAADEFQRKDKSRKQKISKSKPKKGPRLTPKDSTNTAWGSLKLASKGYIHIYKG